MFFFFMQHHFLCPSCLFGGSHSLSIEKERLRRKEGNVFGPGPRATHTELNVLSQGTDISHTETLIR